MNSSEPSGARSERLAALAEEGSGHQESRRVRRRRRAGRRKERDGDDARGCLADRALDGCCLASCVFDVFALAVIAAGSIAVVVVAGRSVLN
ncbi:MAG: hypothetical protein AAF945_20725 [Actinomycetota bacterium]